MRKIAASKTTNKKAKAAEQVQKQKETVSTEVTTSPSGAQEQKPAPKTDVATSTNEKGECVSLAVINQTGNVDDKEPFRKNDDYSENQGGTSEETIIRKEQARAILALPYAYIAEKTGKQYWELGKAELDFMEEPTARLFSQWFSRYADSNPDGYMLGAALIFCTVTRMKMMKKEAQKEQQQGAGENQNQNKETLVAVYD